MELGATAYSRTLTASAGIEFLRIVMSLNAS